eukprot:m.160000 g.160000  ORF g.160000 m.160000 type:complete len:99 (+) comp11887_c0_seq1:131-427(+)
MSGSVDNPEPIENGFIVEFCHNCDGGLQEGKAGAEAVLSVFPDAKVVQRRLNSYPIRVAVYKVEDGNETEIYSGDQRGFFRKNRHRDVPALKKALQSL